MRAADEPRQALHRERQWARVIRTRGVRRHTRLTLSSQRCAHALPVSAACTGRRSKRTRWLLALADRILARRRKGEGPVTFSARPRAYNRPRPRQGRRWPREAAPPGLRQRRWSAEFP